VTGLNQGQAVGRNKRRSLVLPTLALFECCRGPEASRLLLRPVELRELHPVAGGAAIVAAAPSSVEGRWRQLREKWGRESKSVEEILQLEGLTKAWTLLLFCLS
jgi:hypothetical protein